MKRLVILPEGWLCRFGELRPGYFLWEFNLCLKSEYGGEAYTQSGEVFWGGVSDKAARAELIVQPVIYEWEEYEE